MAPQFGKIGARVLLHRFESIAVVSFDGSGIADHKLLVLYSDGLVLVRQCEVEVEGPRSKACLLGAELRFERVSLCNSAL